MRTRIAIFDDNKNIRNSIVLLLSTDPIFEIVGTFGMAGNFLEKVSQCRPDVILMDIEMAGTDDTAMLRNLKKALPHIYILIQTVFEDEERISKLLQAGASGYILKSGLNQSLRQTIIALKETGHL